MGVRWAVSMRTLERLTTIRGPPSPPNTKVTIVGESDIYNG